MRLATLPTLGRYAFSMFSFRGTAGRSSLPIRSGAASKYSKHSLAILPVRAWAKVLFSGYSVKTRQRFVRFTLSEIVSKSTGTIVLRSIISTAPGNCFADSRAQ